MFTITQIQAILQNPIDPESVKYLVAAFGVCLFTRQLYSLVLSLESFNQPNMVAGYRVTRKYPKFGEFLNNLKKTDQQPQQFYEALYHQAIRLPAIFATHLHDIAQLVAKYGDPLTFRSMGLDDITAGEWQQVGMGPEAAGYWIAHEIQPGEAANWMGAGLKDAATVSEWRLLGFNPQAAAVWYFSNFPAVVAAAWASAI
jgi:hypothetical protein